MHRTAQRGCTLKTIGALTCVCCVRWRLCVVLLFLVWTFVRFISPQEGVLRLCKRIFPECVLAVFRIRCSKRLESCSGILQRRSTGAIERPHSMERLGHMTASQTPPLGLDCVQRCEKHGNTEQLVFCVPQTGKRFVRTSQDHWRGLVAQLAVCGWHVGLPVFQLTATVYLEFNVGDDRLQTKCSRF